LNMKCPQRLICWRLGSQLQAPLRSNCITRTLTSSMN
jgi:hypothetical protein